MSEENVLKVLRRSMKLRENPPPEISFTDEKIVLEVWKDRLYERVKKPSHGDVVVDAGAHIGSFTVRASVFVGDSGKVYAFEPDSENYEYLISNTRELKNVVCYQKALWSSSGYKMLHKNLRVSGNSSLYPSWPSVKPYLPVSTTRLDDEVDGQVDFIKIDVEGAEYEVLKGSKRILETYKPFIAMEIHNSKLAQEIISFLSEYGYSRGPYGPVYTFSLG